MKTSYDQIAQSGYLRISTRAVEKTVPVSSNVLCDIDEKGMLCGIEFVNVSEGELQKFAEEMKASEFVSK